MFYTQLGSSMFIVEVFTQSKSVKKKGKYEQPFIICKASPLTSLFEESSSIGQQGGALMQEG